MKTENKGKEKEEEEEKEKDSKVKKERGEEGVRVIFRVPTFGSAYLTSHDITKQRTLCLQEVSWRSRIASLQKSDLLGLTQPAGTPRPQTSEDRGVFVRTSTFMSFIFF